MIKVLGENYYIDLDKVEKYLGQTEISDTGSGSTEIQISLIKFEMVKVLLDTILTEQEDVDNKLGMKSGGDTSISFRLAFNSLLNKKLINYY